MNEYAPAHSMQRILLLVLAFAFVGMGAVSLWQRFAQPDLVVSSNIRQMGGGGNESAARDMGEIGQLMQKIQQNPGDVPAMLHLAEHFMEDQNWTVAEKFLRRAVVAAPDNPKPLYLLGIALHNQGQNAEAADCLERVVVLRDDPSVRYSMGILYAHYLQDPMRGSQHLRTALAQPDLPDKLAELIRTELNELASQASPSKGTPGKKDARPSPVR